MMLNRTFALVIVSMLIFQLTQVYVGWQRVDEVHNYIEQVTATDLELEKLRKVVRQMQDRILTLEIQSAANPMKK